MMLVSGCGSMSFEEIRKRIERIHRKILEEVERTFEETLETTTGAFMAQTGSLKPLYTLYETPDAYIVLVDLAGADTSTIDVRATEDKLIIRASLEKEVRFSDIYGTVVGENIVLRSYEHEIPLPPDADANNIKVNVRPNKIVEIIIPKKRSK